MTAATLSAPPATGSPEEIVRSLTDDQKDYILLALMREAVAQNGPDQVLWLTEPDGRSLGIFVPSAAAPAVFPNIPRLTPEQEARIRHAIATPENTFSVQEMLDRLSREDQG
jgi:hypothetical protein